MSIDYYTYIQSEEWRQRANDAKQRAGYRCQVCNRSSTDITLDAHHRTYEHLGYEDPDDITVLCRDCHELYETHRKFKNLPITDVTPIMESSLSETEDSKYISVESMDSDTEAILGQDEDGFYDPDNHLLSLLGRIVYSVGYMGNGLYLIWMEWAIVLKNPIQLLNPTLQLQVFLGLITSPLFWQLIVITACGIALTFIGGWIANKVGPNGGAIRWYWKWSTSAIIKVPIFLILSAAAIISIVFTGLLWLDIGRGKIDDNAFLLPSNILKIYTLLLPIPVFHLIWDNRFRNSWAKFGLSIVALLLLIAGNLAVDWWWGKQMCTYNLLSEGQCSFYVREISLTASDTMAPTPTPTPATAKERVDSYLRELTIWLARLDRDVSRIEANRSDNGTIYLVGTSIFLTYDSLQKMEVPPKSDTEQVGIEESYAEAHNWLLNMLQPCGTIGIHAMNDEPGVAMISAILKAHDECKERVQLLKDKYPDFFICPAGEACR